MGNYTIFQVFENPRRGRQARYFTTNVPKILDLKSSSELIFFRKLSLGAPEFSFRETLCPVLLTHQIFVFHLSLYFFLPPDTFCPILALFTHFAYSNFFICILLCGIFFLSLMMPLIGESSEFNFNFQFQQSKASLELYFTFQRLQF